MIQNKEALAQVREDAKRHWSLTAAGFLSVPERAV